MILGYDQMGKPLRVGDRVCCVGSRVRLQFRGDVNTIVEPTAASRWADAVVLGGKPHVALDDGYYISASCTIRLDDDDKGSWEDVEKTTKWFPTKEKEKEHENHGT